MILLPFGDSWLPVKDDSNLGLVEVNIRPGLLLVGGRVTGLREALKIFVKKKLKKRS